MSVPLRFRITAWYVVLLTLILLCLSGFLLFRQRTELLASTDRTLGTRANQIALGYAEGGTGFQDVSDASLVGLPRTEAGAQVLSAAGGVVDSSGDPVAERPMIGAATLAHVLAGHRVSMTGPLGSERQRFRVLAVPLSSGPAAKALVVVDSLELVETSQHQLLVLLVTALPVAVGAVGVGGWLLAGRALRPVARITEEASQIGAEALDRRVEVPKAQDELRQLAEALNSMLDRVHQGMQDQHRFLADAAHELRTPLAVMRSELDVELRGSTVDKDARNVLVSTREEVDRMSRMVADLLTLAQADEGELDLLKTPVDLRSVAATVVARLTSLERDDGVRISVIAESVLVSADEDRLVQALSNLVDNAVKYSAAGGEVRVSVWRRGDDAGFSVQDSGAGIPAYPLARVFDRFYRADPARGSSVGGSGLGLAISREIAEAHGGTVWAESEVGRGSTFTLRIPAADDESPSPSSHRPLPSVAPVVNKKGSG